MTVRGDGFSLNLPALGVSGEVRKPFRAMTSSDSIYGKGV